MRINILWLNMNNKNDDLEQSFSGVNTYIGIETSSDDDSCPNICVEFKISPRVFAIAFALSVLEKNCDDHEEDNNKTADM
ncbi:hypothetical protein [Clostridium sp. JN-9]|uniref:hypothetical protein n=1 Tax=Clostridium sp. JN-9 TaxID=2507159 RepID=UPI000FFE00E8|nr:hypothetical protein [Clostridium sp. JN-9]QAT39617.1 hypothetical protein EQM05_04760 [Clostridium sp. JN-9]